MKNSLLLLFQLLCFTYAYNQNYSVEWGESFNWTDFGNQLFLSNEDAFEVKTRAATIHFDHLSPSAATNQQIFPKSKDNMFAGLATFNNELCFFSFAYNEANNQQDLYIHPFDSRSENPYAAPGIKLASINGKMSKSNKLSSKIQTSPDGQKTCIIFKWDIQPISYYVILNNKQEVELFGSFKMPPDEYNQFYILTNNGELYALNYPYSWKEIKDLRLYRAGTTELDRVDLKLGENNYVYHLNISTNNEKNIVFTGLYGQPAKNTTKLGIKGVFHTCIDPNTNRIILSTTQKFDNDFIFKGLSKKKIDKINEDIQTIGYEPELLNFEMRFVEQTNDGGYFAIAESHSFNESYNYYTDLIIFKLDAQGNLLWKDKIYKIHASNATVEPFSSITGLLAEDHFYIMFNDNLSNYDKLTSKIIDKNEIAPLRYAGKHGFGIVSINLESGSHTRTCIQIPDQPEAWLLPKYCVWDKASQSILLSTVTTNFAVSKVTGSRFGRITF